jgi:putative nucleotidyltransferase with HDIG domain
MDTVTESTRAAALLIDGIRDLPTPPLVFSQIVKVVDDPNTSAYEVAAIIAEDPAMSAKVLKITNSAFYGISGTVNSIKQAVVIIGLNGIKSLVVSTSVIDMFKGDLVGREFQEKFWRHSLVTAFGCRMLMRILRPGDFGQGELAFSTGLLHDIGKMVMYLQSAEDAQEAMKAGEEGAQAEIAAERQLFGCDHGEVGRQITQKWSLPAEISNAIAYHHDPLGYEDQDHLTDILHIADALAYHAMSEDMGDMAAPAMKPGVFARSGLKLEAISEYFEKLKAEYLQAETFLNMARGAA